MDRTDTIEIETIRIPVRRWGIRLRLTEQRIQERQERDGGDGGTRRILVRFRDRHARRYGYIAQGLLIQNASGLQEGQPYLWARWKGANRSDSAISDDDIRRALERSLTSELIFKRPKIEQVYRLLR